MGRTRGANNCPIFGSSEEKYDKTGENACRASFLPGGPRGTVVPIPKEHAVQRWM